MMRARLQPARPYAGKSLHEHGWVVSNREMLVAVIKGGPEQMASESDKVMFEIYREAGYGRKFCAVYFTELDDHNKETEISKAMAGEHIYDGFLRERGLGQGKAAVQTIIDRLNDGETIEADQLATILAEFQA